MTRPDLKFDEFASCVQRIAGLRIPLLPETDLVHDIGLAGIDGEDLIDGLRKEYGLEFTDDEVLQHFGPEIGMTPWGHFLSLIGRFEPLPPLRMIDLYQRVRG